VEVVEAAEQTNFTQMVLELVDLVVVLLVQFTQMLLVTNQLEMQLPTLAVAEVVGTLLGVKAVLASSSSLIPPHK